MKLKVNTTKVTPDENIVQQDQNTQKMYGWKNFKTGNISMVYGSMKLLLMCSPDHFETRIKNGEGEIVELDVTVKKYKKPN